MKNIILSILMILTVSCVQTDDFTTPVTKIQEPEITVNSSIDAIKKAYDQSGEKIHTFDPGDDAVFEACVVSSDEAGNFYKTLIIQDAAENPTSGIRVLIDRKSYYTQYNFGRKLYIKVAGMSITAENGNYTLGYQDKNKITEIPETLLDDFIIRSSVTETIIPKKLSFSQFSEKHLNQLIRTENAQFRYDEIGKTFAGEAFDKYSAERLMIQCSDQDFAVLSTSTYAKFKSVPIPENKGCIDAILTMDYSNDKPVLVINDPQGLDFTSADRCDPDFLNCTGDTDGKNILFYEDFEKIKRTNDLLDLDWENINRYGGKEKFKKRSVNGNTVMRISAHGTGENPMEVWLITPETDLQNTTDATLGFQTGASYDNGKILTVWITDDFTGNIESTSWKQINATISEGPSGNSSAPFTSSGKISLNCYSGTIRIAFRYLGGDPGKTTNYDLDHIKITVK